MVGLLVIAGAYFLVFHREPFPGNHEAIGLGQAHLLHDLIGIVLFGVAGIVWWRSRTAAPKVQT